DLLPHGLQRDPEGLEGLGCDALTLVDEAQQDVLGTDEVVVEQARFLLSEDEHSSGSICEAFEQLPASWEGRLHGLILPVGVQFLASPSARVTTHRPRPRSGENDPLRLSPRPLCRLSSFASER